MRINESRYYLTKNTNPAHTVECTHVVTPGARFKGRLVSHFPKKVRTAP